jgi:cell division protein FtsB
MAQDDPIIAALRAEIRALHAALTQLRKEIALLRQDRAVTALSKRRPKTRKKSKAHEA